MFNDKQLQVLKFDIDPNRIKSRSKGNVTLSYLEGFDIIETANKIFGYGNWNYSITKLEQVSQELNQNQNHVICYKAIVKVVVNDIQHTKFVSREDVGFGIGIAKTLADAHENGAKESVTDSLKRCLKSFGNQYGLSLYDKSKQHKTQEQSSPQIPNNQQTPSQLQRTQQSPQVQYEFASLYNLGLQVLERGDNLIVVGEDIFNKKDSIKACGFRWDSTHKVWYLPRQEAA